MITKKDFSPTQRAMLEVLKDGRPHPIEELHACLRDELGPASNVAPHLSAMRLKLRAIGQDILCEYVKRQRLYRWVRLLQGSPMPGGAVF